MELTRRKFITTSGATSAGGLLGSLGLDMTPTIPSTKVHSVRRARRSSSWLTTTNGSTECYTENPGRWTLRKRT